MKNLILKVAYFAFLIFLYCTVSVDAQACEKRVFIAVQDEIGNPINDANVELLPITKDETFGKQFIRDKDDFSRFSIKYSKDQSINEFHKLTISANGYKSAENEIKMNCFGFHVLIKLPKSDSSAMPVWNFDTFVRFSIKDENGKSLYGTKVSFLKNGEVYRVYKPDGSLLIGSSIENGNYIFRFEKDGYQTEDIEVDLNKIAYTNVSATLKSK